MKNEPEIHLEPSHREELRRNAVLDPPAWLDRKILRQIRSRPVLRPFLATGIALAGLLALVTGLTALYAESGLTMPPIMAAALTSLIYLAICSVAVLPVLLFPTRPGPALQHVKETT